MSTQIVLAITYSEDSRECLLHRNLPQGHLLVKSWIIACSCRNLEEGGVNTLPWDHAHLPLVSGGGFDSSC